MSTKTKKKTETEKIEKKNVASFNDEDIADLAKLTAISMRGDHMQFSLGRETVVKKGDRPYIEKGVLTLDSELLGSPQFKIELNGDKWRLTNQCFDNETWVNKKQIDKTAPVELNNGDLITISANGKNLCMLFEDHYDENVAWRTCLLINKNKPITVFSSEALRQMSDANVERKDRENYPHAAFVHRSGRWMVEDVNVGKGIYVNGKAVKQSQVIDVYDVIQIGRTFFVYMPGKLVYSLASAERKNLIVSLDNRTVRNGLFGKKVLLKDISLTIHPGELVLLLGGSGSGKTTLINAITGYEPANAKVLNGGVDVYENYNQMKYEIAVVPQQDLLRGMDSVYMTLLNAASLRMPTSYSAKERRQRVDEVLEEFGLTPQKHNLVKNLSGGQRKRLSIACEFIGDPSLFILDEPDSGLDGVIARELIERLRKIADSGKIVIVITHTPDRVIDLFDHVIVLAKDSSKSGRLAYYGTIDGARTFFKRQRMEDIIKIINPTSEGGEGRADEMVQKYSELRKKEANA